VLVLEPQVCKNRLLIDMHGDLFDSAPCRDVLSARERSAPGDLSEADQVTGYQRHGTPGTFLPRRVGGRIDDDLTEDSPTRVVRIAARNKKPPERLCHSLRFRLRSVTVKMP
jgi:hypothetical protein